MQSIRFPANQGLLEQLVESKRIRVLIDRTNSLEQIAEAHAYVKEGHKVESVAIINHEE